jgi:hypothetical protein
MSSLRSLWLLPLEILLELILLTLPMLHVVNS